MSDDDDQPIRIDQGETRSMLPFLVAAGIIALVVLGIVVAGIVSPAEKNVTDSDRLAVAARNFTDAQTAADPLNTRIVCEGFDDKRSPIKTEHGDSPPKLEFLALRDPQLNGDRGTATVTVKIDGKETTSTWNFTRSDLGWVVCNS